MLKFSEIFEFSKEKFRKIPILKEFEWFEWFGPSPIEPFNSAENGRVVTVVPRRVHDEVDAPLHCPYTFIQSSLHCQFT